MTTPINPPDFSHKLIDELSMSNPIIHSFLTAHSLGYLSYEQALIGMVSFLVSHNAELIKLNIERIEKSAIPTRYIFKQDIK